MSHDLPWVGDAASAAPLPLADETASAVPSALYRAVWRWHFYAGLICLPFLVTMPITGAIYLFRVEIDSVVYRDLLEVAATTAAPRPAEQL
jgi:uncharacterized iron-regulated membrane protein